MAVALILSSWCRRRRRLTPTDTGPEVSHCLTSAAAFVCVLLLLLLRTGAVAYNTAVTEEDGARLYHETAQFMGAEWARFRAMVHALPFDANCSQPMDVDTRNMLGMQLRAYIARVDRIRRTSGNSITLLMDRVTQNRNHGTCAYVVVALSSVFCDDSLSRCLLATPPLSVCPSLLLALLSCLHHHCSRWRQRWRHRGE